MRYRRPAFCSTPPGGGQVKSRPPPPPLQMPSGLVPISPAPQIPRWIRPKPRHCSELRPVQAGTSGGEAGGGVSGGTPNSSLGPSSSEGLGGLF